MDAPEQGVDYRLVRWRHQHGGPASASGGVRRGAVHSGLQRDHLADLPFARYALGCCLRCPVMLGLMIGFICLAGCRACSVRRASRYEATCCWGMRRAAPPIDEPSYIDGNETSLCHDTLTSRPQLMDSKCAGVCAAVLHYAVVHIESYMQPRGYKDPNPEHVENNVMMPSSSYSMPSIPRAFKMLRRKSGAAIR